MELILEKAEGMTLDTIPEENKTVLDDFDININNIKSVSIYKRDKQDCPFNRGNWVCDIRFKDGLLFCLKLPINMEEQAILNFYKPILVNTKIGEKLQ